VAAHKAGVDKAAERRADQVKEGLSLKRQADSLSKVYDWGGAPFEKVAYKRNRYVSGRAWTQPAHWWGSGVQAGRTVAWCDCMRHLAALQGICRCLPPLSAWDS